MASLRQDSAKRWIVDFYGLDKRRRWIRLGKLTQRDADTVHRHVESILAASMAGSSLPTDTAAWLGKIGDAIHAKLAAVGLVEPRNRMPERADETVAAFVKGYIARQSDAKESTKTHWRHTERNLADYFGPNKLIGEVTAGDADDFRQHLIGLKLAITTVNKRCQNAKKFFAAAVRHKLIAENPFAHHKAGKKTNSERLFFVSREAIGDVIDACPDTQWKLIVALARYGGLRCPSELLALKWGDVDWDRNRFTVTSPKTERHEGKGSRVVPIFPELRPYLQAALDELLEDFDPEAQRLSQQPVVTRLRDGETNLRTTFEKIIKRAGHAPWPKLFQNMRSTRETELAEKHPLHVVCAWIGNSPTVAKEHYLQLTEAHYEAAAEPIGGAPPNPLPHASEMAGNGSQSRGAFGGAFAEIPGKPSKSLVLAGVNVGDEGLEKPAQSPRNSGIAAGAPPDAPLSASETAPERPAKAGGARADLARLVGLWAALDASTTARLADEAQEAAGGHDATEGDIRAAVAQLAADWLGGPSRIG